MTTTIKEQEGLFKIIGEKIQRKTEVYIIGGSAMLYYGAKTATKDIDIVSNNKTDRDSLFNTLKGLGFRERSAKILYFEKKKVPVLLQRGEERIDLFCGKVVDFIFTDSIKERITASYEYGNLIVNLISPEDIILLKCATERAGDRLDAASLIMLKNINWDVIINEAVKQMGLIGDIIPLSLLDFMSELKEDLKADIDSGILKKLEGIAEKHLEERFKNKKIIKVTRFK